MKMKYGNKTQKQFEAAVKSFFEGCQKIKNDYFVKQNYNMDIINLDKWDIQFLQKRARVVNDGSAYCFIDFATGDVLKCAGYNAPAKHARGNIYDAANGLASIGPYGPAYLR
jgi:hypothetical protein